MGKKEELPAQPKQRKEGSGVWEKGEGGLPFIEPSSGHVRLHQQMAGSTTFIKGQTSYLEYKLKFHFCQGSIIIRLQIIF
ncbi:hypothetical protein ZEAMMB73_Zm00001d016327 [Zea mays]|uniref:Uncharacterized protein n=1 Tax=Zea mays TaxID=4577 RepID=A0A1D6H6T2_MAIZE|nr:hypothetical protein ZEAMMB73_Zm00001d016327 [Zea mays]